MIPRVRLGRTNLEVAANAALAESFRPEFDMADLPRLTANIYKTEGERNAAGSTR